MKGVLLAGGTGSRLFPLTKVTNKHLLPIGRKPMIFHPLDRLLECGIQDILIVTGTEHMGDIITLLGSGKSFGAHFTYKVQDEAGGIAQALSLAEDFAGGGKVMALLGDNIFGESLRPFASRFREQRSGARLLLKDVPDAERFGVAELKDGRIISIKEKPKRPKSTLAVTGCYFYGPDVFSILKTLKPSERGELEITDVNTVYVTQGLAEFDILSGWWSDAGTFESLKRANQLLE